MWWDEFNGGYRRWELVRAVKIIDTPGIEIIDGVSLNVMDSPLSTGGLFSCVFSWVGKVVVAIEGLRMSPASNPGNFSTKHATKIDCSLIQ